MNELQANLLAIAKNMRHLTEVNQRDDAMFPHPSIEEFALVNGHKFESLALTDIEREVVLAAAGTAQALGKIKFRPEDTFLNAQMLVIHDPCAMLQYVEGYVWMPEFEDGILHHAWASLNGKVVDLTVRTYPTKRVGNRTVYVRPKPSEPKFADRVLGVLPDGYQYHGVRIEDRNTLRQCLRDNRGASPLLESLWLGTSMSVGEAREHVSNVVGP